MIPTRIGAVLLLVPALGAAVQETGREPLLRSDPALQASIRRVLDAPNEAEQRTSLDSLRATAGARHERLVPQLFLLLREATDTREAMAFGFVVHALPIPPEHVVGALVPLLESPDVALRAAVAGVFSEYEDHSLDRGASFDVYRPLLAQGPPLGLARHLFEVDPDAALLALLRVQATDPAELRPLLWARHEVADALWKLRFGFVQPAELARAEPEALVQLGILARHRRWDARLYAARVAELEPALRPAVPLDVLRGDEHALVRETAARALEAKR